MASIDLQSSPSLTAGLSRWTPSLPTGLITMLNPFATSDNSPKQSSSETANAAASQSPSRPSRLALNPNGPPSPSESDMSVSMMFFAEPDTRSTSDAGSREGSIDGAKASKKSNRRKTRFSVCHAPPTSTTRHKLHRRPRSLVQLHKLTANARPLPAFEVVPSANFSVRLTRAITKVFKARHSLCPNDLVVLRAENYSDEAQDDDEEARSVIGLICKGRKDESGVTPKARICFMDGKEWDAYPMTNGGYEFSTIDEHGLLLTARWVPKKNKDGSKMKDRRFNFSTISPNTRRHPVIANLSQTRLEVNDFFKLPEPSSATPLVTPVATPKQTSTILADTMEEDGEPTTRQMCETDDALRELIALTGIWVIFKEGWSPTFRYEESKDMPGMQRAGSLQGSPVKSTTSLVSTPPGSPYVLPVTHDKRSNSIKSISSSFLSRGKGSLRGVSGPRASIMSSQSLDETPEQKRAPDSEQTTKTGRKRADSNSTVLVHRAASNRRKNNHHQAVWRPDLLTAQQSVEERSREPSREDVRPSPSPSPRASPAPDHLDGSPIHNNQPSTAALASTNANSTNGASTPVATDGSLAKRVSTTTDDTVSSSVRAPKARTSTIEKATSNGKRASRIKSKSKGTKRSGKGWRRFLCGSADEEP